jgi:hypothetical protein
MAEWLGTSPQEMVRVVRTPLRPPNYTQMNIELTKLKAQRDALNVKIAELEAQEMGSAQTFKEKIRIWVDSENGEELDWIPSKETYPVLRECIRGAELNRYQTYDLRDFFEDEIYCILDDNIELVNEKTIAVLTEAVEKNLHSFKMDW